jgi:hypothetical protein
VEEEKELMKILKLKLPIWEMHAGLFIILQLKYKLDNIEVLKLLFINLFFFFMYFIFFFN